MNYSVKTSNRKTLQLQITADGEVLVRAPYFCSKKQIDEFVNSHSKWIEKSKERVKIREKTNENIDLNKEELIKKAKEVLPEKVAYFSSLCKLYPESVKITSAKTRFGSCSYKNGICFSFRLMYYPEEAVDYVVLHEIAHIKYRNHSLEFYKFIEKYMPDYKRREKILKNYS